MIINAQPLTAEAFEPFGQVIEVNEIVPQSINEGHTDKYPDLATLYSQQGSEFSVHLYRSKALEGPVVVRKLECHALGHQAFIPLHSEPFPVVVARAGDPPGPHQLHVFMSNGRQGINLSPGTWHHYQISLSDGCEYLVIERSDSGNDCQVAVLDEPVTVALGGDLSVP